MSSSSRAQERDQRMPIESFSNEHAEVHSLPKAHTRERLQHTHIRELGTPQNPSAMRRWQSSVQALLLACALSLQALSHTRAHSWLECTDYRMDPNSADAKTWNPSVCHGRARCGGTQMNATFGQDTGFNEHSAKCQCARDSPKNDAPVAQYVPGQRVCLAYPPKNHVAAPCTNEFIPDAGVRIMRSGVNPTSDDALASEYAQGNGAHTFGQIDYKGFQNCPNFCDDKEGALCTMCFDLERDLAPGSYTFKWVWAFNGLDDVYTTCWEANVGGAPTTEAAPSTPASAPPSSIKSTPTVTVTAVAHAANDDDCDDALAMPDDDCDDALDMADDDCDEELDMAGGDEVGGEAEAGPEANAGPAGGIGKSNHVYDAASHVHVPVAGTAYVSGTTPSVAASETAKPQVESGAAPSGPGAYAATASAAHAPRNQHGSHQRWHMHNGHQPHANSQPHIANGKPGIEHPLEDVDGKGGDDDPDCELPIANTQQPTNLPVTMPTLIAPNAESANAGVGGAPNDLLSPPPVANEADPDCEDELPYAYETQAPLASDAINDEDCDDELPMADPSTAAGAIEHAHAGDSYSFNANPQPESESAVVGSVLPYPGESY